MRQVLMLAMLCVAGVASAIMTWGDGNTWTSGGRLTKGEDTPISFTAGTNFSVALVFDVGNVETFKRSGIKLLQLSYRPNAELGKPGPHLDVRTNGDVYSKQRNNGSKEPIGISLEGLHTGENVFGMTVEYTESNSIDKENYPYDVTYTLFLNGEQVGSYKHSNVGKDVDDFRYIRNGDGADYYYGIGLAKGEDFANLPEPTALALLALGVAGVALRRRVA